MINHAANEEICSAKYVDSFLDAIENLPDEVQRKITIMRELDIRYQALLNEMDTLRQELEERVNPDSLWVKRLLVHLQDKLIESQDVADEKLAAVQAILDLIEVKQAQLENNAKNLRSDSDNERSANETSVRNINNNNEPSERPSKRPRRTPRMDSSSFSYNTTASNIATATTSGPAPSSTNSNVVATSTVHLHSHGNGGGAGAQAAASSSAASASVASVAAGGSSSSTASAAAAPQQDATHAAAAEKNASQKAAAAKNSAQKKATKKKKRKARAERERDDSPPEMPIDPDEPTYCLCEQVSYGEMIGCDNDLCPIEWFHFSCVNLTHKPKGKWFCPKCRGDKPTIMKPRAQFLRELEKYNKEKEEKS